MSFKFFFYLISNHVFFCILIKCIADADDVFNQINKQPSVQFQYINMLL